MSISERINPDKLNIHQFQETPEGKFRLPFDAEKDIDSSKRDALLNDIEKCKDTNLTHHVFLLARFKFLWPSIDVPMVPPSEIENWHNQLLQSAKKEDVNERTYCIFVCDALRAGYKLNLTKDDRQIIGKQPSSIDIFHDWVRPAAELKITDPDIYQKKFEGTGITSIDELTKIENYYKSSERFALFSHYVSYMRLLNPGFKPTLTEKEWKNLMEYFHGIDSSNSVGFIEVAWQMKILAADKVEVTAPGVIDIQMYPPADVNTSTPPIPETRKF